MRLQNFERENLHEKDSRVYIEVKSWLIASIGSCGEKIRSDIL
jgi:hypothetical protein